MSLASKVDLLRAVRAVQQEAVGAVAGDEALRGDERCLHKAEEGVEEVDLVEVPQPVEGEPTLRQARGLLARRTDLARVRRRNRTPKCLRLKFDHLVNHESAERGRTS